MAANPQTRLEDLNCEYLYAAVVHIYLLHFSFFCPTEYGKLSCKNV